MRLIADGLVETKDLNDARGTWQQLSKAIELNGHYALVWPLSKTKKGKPDVVTCTFPGRDCNFDVCHTAFVPIDEVEPGEFNKYIDKSGLGMYASVTKVIHHAEYAEALSDAKAKAVSDAAKLNKEPNAAALEATFKDIKLKYYGGKVNDKNIMPDVNPILGAFKNYCSTAVTVIKLDEKANIPDSKVNPVQAIIKIGKTKEDALTTILSTHITEEDIERGYFITLYSYFGADKKAAGMAASFQYLKHEDTPEVKAPDWWKENGPSIISRIPKKPEQIASHDANANTEATPASVMSDIKKYISTKEILAYYVREDLADEDLKKGAKAIQKLGIWADDVDIQQRLLELVGSDSEEEESQDTTTKINKDSTLQEIMEQDGGMSSLSDDDAYEEMEAAKLVKSPEELAAEAAMAMGSSDSEMEEPAEV